MHFWCDWRRVKSSGDTCILKCQLASHLSITATKRLRQLGSTECETQYIPFYILNCLWNKRSFFKVVLLKPTRAVNLSISMPVSWTCQNAFYKAICKYKENDQYLQVPWQWRRQSVRTTQIIKNTFNKTVREFSPALRNAPAATKLDLFYEQDDFLLLCGDAVRVYIIHARHIFILSTELFWVASRHRRLCKVTINYLS